MSRTDLDVATIANCLRARAGDGSIEWVSEPIQASVLLDAADMLDENTKLRDGRNLMYKANVKKNREVLRLLDENARLRQELEAVGTAAYLYGRNDLADENAKLRELCAGLLTGYECGHGELCKGCTWDGLGDPKTFPCLPRVKARELGVEVTDA